MGGAGIRAPVAAILSALPAIYVAVRTLAAEEKTFEAQSRAGFPGLTNFQHVGKVKVLQRTIKRAPQPADGI